MRKHFLLFFLMLLLPLGAWAEDISTASVAVGNIVKGTAELGNPFVVWEGEELTKNTHYTVEGVYTKSGNDYVAIEGALSAQSFGTYYLKISGIPEHGFQGDAYGAFEITKRPLTIDFDAVAKTYGDAAVAPSYTIRDGDDALNPEDEADAAIIAGLGIQAVTKSGANVIEITNTTDAGNYDFDFTYNETDDCDYTLTRKAGDNDKYVISAKSIDAAGMTVAMGTPGTYNYTGNAITGLPTFTVKDGETNVTTFNVKWFAAELSNDPETSDDDEVTPTNAGTYYARVTGTGNYAGKVFDNDNWKITVNPVALTVLVNPKSKTYDGQNYTTADVEYTFGGLVDADQGKVNLASLTPTKDGAAWANFKDYKEGGYTIGVNVGAATIGAEPAIALNTNYTVTPVSSVWTINKITGLTISAANKSINYGAAIPESSEITATGALAAEKDDIEALYVAPKAVGAKNDVYGTQPAIYTPALIEVGEGGYENAEDKAAAEAVLANYTFADPAIVAGNLSVGGQNAMIMPIVASVIYDGQAHAATGYSATSGAYILTEWDGEAGDIDVTNISYKYKKQNPEDLTWSEYSTTVPSAVGVYRAQVAATSISGKGNFAGAEIARPEVQFEIQKRPITITVTGATLHKGDKEANLENHTEYTKEGSYVEGENVVLKPVFTGVEGLTLDEETQKVTNGSGDVIADAVVMTDDVEGDNDNANYKFTFVPGNLTIAASELVLDPTVATLATQITEAAATGEKYDVTFANLTMKANEWYAMVLPFDVDPKEMVIAADRYVIFNELNKAKSTDSEFKFTLKFDAIEAGTPFLIKFAGEADDIIDLAADLDPEHEGDQPMKFRGVDITAGIKDVKADHVTFTGTYASNVEIQGSRDDGSENYVWWLCDTRYKDGAKGNNWLKPISKAHKLNPMDAYLDGTESSWTGYAPKITVEDFDGSVTSIKSISTDEIHGMTAKGMYNLNGMKMSNVPTQKGVYIVNGKKVVIK